MSESIFPVIESNSLRISFLELIESCVNICVVTALLEM